MSEEKQPVKELLKQHKENRATKQTKAEMEKSIVTAQKGTYTKNLAILAQMDKHRNKCIGNAKLNEDEYERKKGRMKILNATYEWELDDAQIAFDESRLKQTYEDTRGSLAFEIVKIDETVKKVLEQQERLEKLYPEFTSIELKRDELISALMDEVDKYKPEGKAWWNK